VSQQLIPFAGLHLGSLAPNTKANATTTIDALFKPPNAPANTKKRSSTTNIIDLDTPSPKRQKVENTTDSSHNNVIVKAEPVKVLKPMISKWFEETPEPSPEQCEKLNQFGTSLVLQRNWEEMFLFLQFLNR